MSSTIAAARPARRAFASFGRAPASSDSPIAKMMPKKITTAITINRATSFLFVWMAQKPGLNGRRNSLFFGGQMSSISLPRNMRCMGMSGSASLHGVRKSMRHEPSRYRFALQRIRPTKS